MRGIAFLLTLLAGLALGVMLTQLSLTHGAEIARARYGIWYFIPKIGALELDPYHRAWLFSRGELPVAEGEGFSLHTKRDSSGTLLHATCTYRLEGALPPAQYWTLAVTDQDGRRLTNRAGRFGFSSSELVYQQDRPLSLVLSPEVQPGNWLPLSGEGEISVILRFYETPLSASATNLTAAQLPTLTRVGCNP